MSELPLQKSEKIKSVKVKSILDIFSGSMNMSRSAVFCVSWGYEILGLREVEFLQAPPQEMPDNFLHIFYMYSRLSRSFTARGFSARDPTRV